MYFTLTYCEKIGENCGKYSFFSILYEEKTFSSDFVGKMHRSKIKSKLNYEDAAIRLPARAI